MDLTPKPGDVTPPKPQGRALRWSAADLQRLSRVGPADEAEARADFRRLAPASVRGLLDGTDDDETTPAP